MKESTDGPVRGEFEQFTAHSPWHKQQTSYSGTETRHVVNNGAIETYREHHQQILTCGHMAPPVGACSECEQLVCEQCLTRCSCMKPIAPCCGRVFESKSGPVMVCPTCHSALSRKRFLQRLLSPFIEFDDEL